MHGDCLHSPLTPFSLGRLVNKASLVQFTRVGLSDFPAHRKLYTDWPPCLGLGGLGFQDESLFGFSGS